MKRTYKYAVAASLAAVIGLGAWLLAGAGSSGLAFADVREEVGRIKSITYKCICLVEDREPQATEFAYRAPGQARKVYPGGSIELMDYVHGKMMTLWPQQKQAHVYDDARLLDRDANVVETIQKARDGGSEEVLGERLLDGRRTVCFEIHREGKMDMKVWADPKTQLPVRVELTGRAQSPRIEFVMKDFRYNMDLDDALFVLTPPEGYSTQFTAPMSAATLVTPTPTMQRSGRSANVHEGAEDDVTDEANDNEPDEP